MRKRQTRMKKFIFLCAMLLAASPVSAKSNRHHVIQEWWRTDKLCLAGKQQSCDERDRLTEILENNGCTRTPQLREYWNCRSAKTIWAPGAPTETAPKAVPGAVELDKIPSNVQTVGASAFDGTKAPNLLQSLDRALPGVSLSGQTGNEFQLHLNYRGTE
jgi:hypothetical protein